jgi:dipeptidyl aminopeptidase/acylaminoacyl peptidase
MQDVPLVRRAKMISRFRLSFPLAAAIAFAAACVISAPTRAQESAKSHAAEKPHAMSKTGKKLFGADDALHVHNISNVHASDDDNLVIFTATELATDSEEPGAEMKFRTQLWDATYSTDRENDRIYGLHQLTRGKQSVGSPALSPKDWTIAFLRATEEKDSERQVWFFNGTIGEPEKITAHKGGFSTVTFSPDGTQLLLTAGDQATKEDEARKKQKDDPIVVDHDIRMSHLWLYDIAAKKETRLTDGDFTVSDAQFSPDGKWISFTSNPTPRADDGDLTTIWILNPATKEKHKLLSGDVLDHTARWSPDGKWIAYLASPHAGGVKKTDLFVVAPDGAGSRKLTEKLDLDAGTPAWSRDGQTIYFSSNDREAEDVFSVPAAGGPVTQVTQLQGTFNLAQITGNHSRFGGNLAVGVYSDSQHPGEVASIDISTKSISSPVKVNKQIEDYAMGETEVVKWKSTDGTEVEGVLYRPVDFDPAKKYPFLLNPHGGPTGSSTLSFGATSQIMAANGYLVLQPNFRGSTGRGEAFAEANHNDWGKGDYEDCITGVKAIVARGIADPNRLGAFGWSYGGYMTFWILTQTDMFKAISPGAGLTDLAAMYAQNDVQSYLRWFFNDKYPWQDQQIWWDHSPMKFANNVKTPALILQGQSDTRVPMAQAQEMYRAMLDRGIPVEFVLYPRENHGFTEPKHIEDRYLRYLTFFGKYLDNPPVTDAPLKPAPVAAPAAADPVPDHM